MFIELTIASGKVTFLVHLSQVKEFVNASSGVVLVYSDTHQTLVYETYKEIKDKLKEAGVYGLGQRVAENINLMPDTDYSLEDTESGTWTGAIGFLEEDED